MSHTCPVFFPVVHPISHAMAMENVHLVVDAQADGVFVIDQGMTAEQTLRLAADIVAKYPNFPVGVNILSQTPATTVRSLPGLGVRMLWSDDGGAESPAALAAFDRARLESGWQGLYFGGVSFKYKAQIPYDRLADVLTAKVRTTINIVTTSGDGTGIAPKLAKIRAFRDALGPDGLLGNASGITPDNLSEYLPLVDAFLVATGIETKFGVLNEERTRRFAQLMREYREACSTGRRLPVRHP